MKAVDTGQTVVYARVSGVTQKRDLANQVKALEQYCQDHQIPVDAWLQDIGSGLNYKRKNFNCIMEMVELGQIKRLIIAHRDRLVRFGFGYFATFCQRHNCDIVIVNDDTFSPEQEMVHDLIAITTVFSARIHGLRSYKRGLKDAAMHKD